MHQKRVYFAVSSQVLGKYGTGIDVDRLVIEENRANSSERVSIIS